MKRLAVILPWLALLAGTPAMTAELFPHEPGRTWRYVTPSGRHDVLVAGDPIIVTVGEASYLAQPFTFAAGSVHEGSSELILVDSDGAVLLLGGANAAGAGLLFDPPLALLPAPERYGDEPSEYSASAHPLPSGDPWVFLYHLEVRVAPLSVPAGIFDGIAGALSALSSFAAGSGEPDVWAAGVGCIQYADSEVFQLEGVDAPTTARAGSWGAIKRLYR